MYIIGKKRERVHCSSWVQNIHVSLVCATDEQAAESCACRISMCSVLDGQLLDQPSTVLRSFQLSLEQREQAQKTLDCIPVIPA